MRFKISDETELEISDLCPHFRPLTDEEIKRGALNIIRDANRKIIPIVGHCDGAENGFISLGICLKCEKGVGMRKNRVPNLKNPSLLQFAKKEVK